MVTEADVEAVYQAILGRSPESAAIVQHWIASTPDLRTLISSTLKSDEFQRKRQLTGYEGISTGDVALLSKHLVRSEPEPGFIQDFVGTKTSASYVNLTKHMSGQTFNRLPIPGDWHAPAIEWVGAIKAVEASSDHFVAAELGAGWGPWVVASGHIARRLGRTPIRLYPVEADPAKFQFLLDHLSNNGFSDQRENAQEAIIGPRDGFAHYPIIDAAINWGAGATFEDVSDASKFRRVKSITISHLLSNEPLFDFVHCDIQGAELEVISASISALSAKARYLVVGTHSRSIEAGLLELLSASGWRLENEQPAKHNCSGAIPFVVHDGTQVWRNTAL